MDAKTEKKLQVRNLRISFRTNAGKVQAVRDISFDLNRGETLAIVGESGSGKSVTSKAILGIQAPNAINEGGQILFDGQDLLKIGEEDFYRLRGDKLAMIFQDPLSSLNPIMRIGKQLTEAMILKGKARQKSCRETFDSRLSTLEKFMTEARKEKADEIHRQCELFRRFESRASRLEQEYNEAHESAENALVEIENILYQIDKNVFTDAKERLKEVRTFTLKTVHPFVMPDEDQVKSLADSLTAGLHEQIHEKNYSRAEKALKDLQRELQSSIEKAVPDFFGMGYYQETEGCGLPVASIEEQNAFYATYIQEHFLNDFSQNVEAGLADADRKYHTLRQKALEVLEQGLPEMKNASTDISRLHALTEGMGKAVDESICPLDLVKDSAACTFHSSLKGFTDTLDKGTRTNWKAIRKYERQLEKFNRIVASGKEPDWKVAAPATVDLDQVRENMVRQAEYMAEHYREKNALSEDPVQQTEAMIFSLRDAASGMIRKVTRRAARNRALKLMEEVGIPEPRKRYRAYPFQFSGGMRQRIVIAIALAANPEVLICDEPTTALDVTIQAQILELINRLKKERNLSIIFITHDLGVVANMADRIAVMYAGKIVEYGTSDDIFYSPAHPYTWALLSSMPDLDTKEKLEAIPGTPPNMIYPPKGDAFAERNRYAMKIDFEKQPPAFRISDTHWASTWLLHPDAPHIDPPKTVTDRIAKMKARTEARNHE